MSNKVEYHNGKIGSMIRYTMALIKNDPTLLDDFEKVKNYLFLQVPELKNKTKCPNCDASMKEYIYIFDTWDALLLKRMAEIIREKVHNGMSFTEANRVRVPDMDAPHSVKCRTTKASKLGLVAKVQSRTSKRPVPGTWLVTRRGWEALKGDPVPKKVRVWRGHIEERFDETTTMFEAMKSHTDFVQKRINAGKDVKDDYRYEISQYNSQEWYEFGIHEGKIFTD